MALNDVLVVPLVRAVEGEQATTADLVSLKVGDATIKSVLWYKNESISSAELLKMNEWINLRQLLGQFKVVCTENDIVPIVVFLPTTAHIYAEYSMADSGPNWLAIRDQQIAAKDNVELALTALCREVGLEVVSLSPAFRRAASQGKLLYYPFDSHWNSEGRQVAASVLAERLISGHAMN